MPINIKKDTDKAMMADVIAKQMGAKNFSDLKAKALAIGANRNNVVGDLRVVIAKQLVWKMLETNNKLLKYVNFVDSKWGGFDQIISTGMARLSQFIQYLNVNEHWTPEQIDQLVPKQFFDTVELGKLEILMNEVFLDSGTFVDYINKEASTMYDVLDILWENRLKKGFEQIPLFYKVAPAPTGADPTNQLAAQEIYWRAIANNIWILTDYMERPSTLFNELGWPANTPKANQTIIFNTTMFGKFNFAVQGDTYNFKDIKNGGMFGNIDTYPFDSKIVAIIFDNRYSFYVGNVANKSTDQDWARTTWQDRFVHDFRMGGQIRHANAIIITTDDLLPVTDSIWDHYDQKGKLIDKYTVTRKNITATVDAGDIGIKLPFYIHSHLQNWVKFSGVGTTPTEAELKAAIVLANPKFVADNVTYENIKVDSVQLVPKAREMQGPEIYYALGSDVGYPYQVDYFKLKFVYTQTPPFRKGKNKEVIEDEKTIEEV